MPVRAAERASRSKAVAQPAVRGVGPPMTAVEKILARAAGRKFTEPGEVLVAQIDRAVVLDTLFMPTGLQFHRPCQVSNPEAITLVLDHAVPAPSISDANAAALAREFARQFGIRDFFDVGGHGISHQVIAEQGLARPGELLVSSDSHTCAGGAFNCAARGVGGMEMLQVICTGSTWFMVAPTIQVTLTGALADHNEGKDLFLALAQRWGWASGNNLEFGGSGLAGLSLHDRRTVATQCAELNPEFVVFPADEVVRTYLTERGVKAVAGVTPDPGAVYAANWELDLGQVEPMLAKPGGVVDKVVPVRAAAGTRLDQCFVGSCANGHLEDFRTAAQMLKGRHVAPSLRLILTPASQGVYLDAARAGYLTTIVEAGGVVTNSTCGACFGYHMGVVGDGEVCLTSSTRNFKGRMGSPNSEVFIASTSTVIASAIAGSIQDPREVAR